MVIVKRALGVVGVHGMAGVAGIALALTGCGSSAPIVLHPKAPLPPPNTACVSGKPDFEIRRVDDARGYADNKNVGFTQTGLYNVKASLELDRPASALLRDSLAGALARCGRSGTGRPLVVQLLTLQVTEESGFTSEKLRADTRYDVIALHPETSQPLGRFTVTGKSEHSGLDTTGDAEPVIVEAIRSSLPGFLRGLASLPEPRAGAQALVATGLPAPIRVALRRLSTEEEEERFSVSLAERQVLAVALHIDRVSGSMDVVEFHRQDFHLVFPDGRFIVPLDPLKVRERMRTETSIMTYSGGMMFPAGTIASMPDSEALQTTIEALRFGSKAREIDGLLFFDLQGLPLRDGQTVDPSSLDVYFTNVATGETGRATARYPARTQR